MAVNQCTDAVQNRLELRTAYDWDPATYFAGVPEAGDDEAPDPSLIRGTITVRNPQLKPWSAGESCITRWAASLVTHRTRL